MKAKLQFIISLLTAFLPMLTGSMIFWVWFYHPNFHKLESWGGRIILISVPICIAGIILANLVRRKNKDDRKTKNKVRIVTWFILSNIPLSIFYVWFAAYLQSTDRVT